MDITPVAQSLVAYLAPFLPYLMKAGEKVVEEGAKKFGTAAWDQALAVWNKIRPQMEAKPAAVEAAQDVAEAPDDEDAQATLRQQLKKLLRDDPDLTSEIEKLIKSNRISTTVTASGTRSVAIGGNVSGGSITTGDTGVTRGTDDKSEPS